MIRVVVASRPGSDLLMGEELKVHGQHRRRFGAVLRAKSMSDDLLHCSIVCKSGAVLGAEKLIRVHRYVHQ